MLSAEIEAVPAGKTPRFRPGSQHAAGLWPRRPRVRLCLAGSHPDPARRCPRYTCCCLLADKEEIGSVGATGMRAHYFENAMAELIGRCAGEYSELTLRRALRACRMLSCDVSAGFDPLYASAFEKKNAAILGRGVCYNKFTGSRGKSGSNDANAEFIGRLRKIMDDNHVYLADGGAGQGGRGRRRNHRLYLRAVRHGSDRQRRACAVHARAAGDHQQGRSVRGCQGLSRLHDRGIKPTY